MEKEKQDRKRPRHALSLNHITFIIYESSFSMIICLFLVSYLFWLPKSYLETMEKNVSCNRDTHFHKIAFINVHMFLSFFYRFWLQNLYQNILKIIKNHSKIIQSTRPKQTKKHSKNHPKIDQKSSKNRSKIVQNWGWDPFWTKMGPRLILGPSK